MGERLSSGSEKWGGPKGQTTPAKFAFLEAREKTILSKLGKGEITEFERIDSAIDTHERNIENGETPLRTSEKIAEFRVRRTEILSKLSPEEVEELKYIRDTVNSMANAGLDSSRSKVV